VKTYTHLVATFASRDFALLRAPVTLPAPPWGALDAAGRAETTPRSPIIRRADTTDPLRTDPVLRHANVRRDRG
jgi:hypothetical protein